MNTVWRKSSLSFANGRYVEGALLGGSVGISDTSDAEGPALKFTPIEWHAFLDGMACHRDGPRDYIETALHLPSCAQATEPDATRLLSVSCIEQADVGDTFRMDRASPDVTPTLDYSRESLVRGRSRQDFPFRQEQPDV